MIQLYTCRAWPRPRRPNGPAGAVRRVDQTVLVLGGTDGSSGAAIPRSADPRWPMLFANAAVSGWLATRHVRRRGSDRRSSGSKTSTASTPAAGLLHNADSTRANTSSLPDDQQRDHGSAGAAESEPDRRHRSEPAASSRPGGACAA